MRCFGLSEISDLAISPSAYLRGRLRRAASEGYGYPERRWRYGALGDYHSGDRSLEALRANLAARLAAGVGPTPTKQLRLAQIGRLLERRYVPRDRVSSLAFRGLDYVDRPTPREWRGHCIALPLGLAFDSNEGQVLRLVWVEQRLSLRNLGTPLVIAATLAYALSDPAVDGARPRIVEVFQLRDPEFRRFDVEELMSRWPRLHEVLSWAEAQPERPAA